MELKKKSLKIILAQPRGFCAGVERAIEIVERALKIYGPPVYVRHEIVHNKRVVNNLSSKGAVFVKELDQIPKGAVTVFSAHGVSQKVEDTAGVRKLPVLDATCPLVAKVHKEGQRYSKDGFEVVMTPLKQTHFRNGDRITESRTPQEWESNLKNKVPSYQYEDFDPNNNHIFYNVYALRDKRNLAPQGFHVMDVREFGQLNTDLKFPLDRKVQCYSCSGSGKVDNIVSCKKCSHWSETQHQYNVCRSCNGRRNWKSGYKKCPSCNGSKFNSSCSFQDLTCPLFHKPSERIITFTINAYGKIYLTNGNEVNKKYGDKLVVFVVKDKEKKSVYSNEYYTVGELEIMKNYLSVTKFKNGDPIKYIEDPVEWSRAIKNGTPAYCYHNNLDSGIGCIYNIHALSDRRGLIPDGWRSATEMDAKYLNANLKTIPNESIDPIFYDRGKLDYRNRKIPISKPPGGRTDKGDFKNYKDYLTHSKYCGLNFEIENNELELGKLLEESRNKWKYSDYQGSGYLICVRDGIRYEKPSSVEKVKIVNPTMSKRTNKKSIRYGDHGQHNMSTFKELYNETGKHILNNLQISNLEGLFDGNGELNLIGIGGKWSCNGELEYAFKGGRNMCGIKLKRVSKNNEVKFYGAIMYGHPSAYRKEDNFIMKGELFYDGEINLEFSEPIFEPKNNSLDQTLSLYFDKSSCDLSNNPINNLTVQVAGLTCFKYGSEPRFWSYNWYSEESKTMAEIQEFLDNYSIDDIVK